MRSEREKMLAGELYQCSDTELVALRRRAKILIEKYNQSSSSEPILRREIIFELFDQEPKNLNIIPPFFCDYGYHISLGENVLINNGCTMLDTCQITIGDRAWIAPNVQLYAATHPLDAELRGSGICIAKPIRVGKDCWIGGNSVILPGVTIGDRAVIGAGSVVTKDVPADALVFGNPARLVRYIEQSNRQASSLDEQRAPSY